MLKFKAESTSLIEQLTQNNLPKCYFHILNMCIHANIQSSTISVSFFYLTLFLAMRFVSGVGFFLCVSVYVCGVCMRVFCMCVSVRGCIYACSCVYEQCGCISVCGARSVRFWMCTVLCPCIRACVCADVSGEPCFLWVGRWLCAAVRVHVYIEIVLFLF